MKCEAVMMNPFIFMVFFVVMMFDDMYLSLWLHGNRNEI